MARSIKTDAIEVREHLALAKTLIKQLERLTDVAEVRSIEAKAEALQVWAARAKHGRELAIQAGEIRVRAARRGGILLAALKKGYGRGGASPYSDACEGAGLPQWQAALWQRAAAVDEDDFEAEVADARDKKRWPSLRRILRGKVDQPKQGCIVMLKFDESETRRLDTMRGDVAREEFLEDFVREALFIAPHIKVVK